MTDHRKAKPRLRSRLWFDNPDNPGMTALYLERYLNYGLTKEELTAGKPIIAIAQTGSDLSPCNRHHLELAKRVRGPSYRRTNCSRLCSRLWSQEHVPPTRKRRCPRSRLLPR